MLKGSCLCGSVQYEADCEPNTYIHCHCQACRKAHIWRSDAAPWFDPEHEVRQLPEGYEPV